LRQAKIDQKSDDITIAALDETVDPRAKRIARSETDSI